MGIWNNKDKLDELELIREKHRQAGKLLTFDCMNLIVEEGGEKATCRKGRLHSVSLLLVLRGACYTPCIECPYWTEEVSLCV